MLTNVPTALKPVHDHNFDRNIMVFKGQPQRNYSHGSISRIFLQQYQEAQQNRNLKP